MQDSNIQAPDDGAVITIKGLGVLPQRRQVHTKRAPRKSKALTTDALHPHIQAEAPVASETIPKGRALTMIEDAGYDSKDFAKALDIMVTAGIVKKDGQQYVIPVVYVQKHIKKLEADRG